jgi:hypothetical protein
VRDALSRRAPRASTAATAGEAVGIDDRFGERSRLALRGRLGGLAVGVVQNVFGTREMPMHEQQVFPDRGHGIAPAVRGGS